MEHRNINTVGTIFNDFLGLYTGERPVGIHELIQKYDRHPVLMGLLSNVDSVIYVDVKKAMYEIYPFYKNTDIVHWMIVCGKTLLRVRRPLKRSGMETFGYAG